MSGDFREFFDLRQFDDRQLGEVEFVLNSPAYEHTFRPYIQGVINQMNTLWKDRSKERSDKYPDDFLAGGVIFAEGLVKFFDLVVKETRMERVHDAMAQMTPENAYDIQRHRGNVKPVVGLDQPALPVHVDPAEDY